MKGWLVWRGCGSLVLLLSMLGWRVATAATDYVLGEPPSEAAQTDVAAIGLLLGAALVLALDVVLGRNERPRGLLVWLFGFRNGFAPRHEFLLVPVAAWPYLLAAAGTAALCRY